MISDGTKTCFPLPLLFLRTFLYRVWKYFSIIKLNALYISQIGPTQKYCSHKWRKHLDDTKLSGVFPKKWPFGLSTIHSSIQSPDLCGRQLSTSLAKNFSLPYLENISSLNTKPSIFLKLDQLKNIAPINGESILTTLSFLESFHKMTIRHINDPFLSFKLSSGQRCSVGDLNIFSSFVFEWIYFHYSTSYHFPQTNNSHCYNI